MNINYITLKEAGEKWKISSRMVNIYCTNGRIKGAIKIGNLWLIPSDALKPDDRRKKEFQKD